MVCGPSCVEGLISDVAMKIKKRLNLRCEFSSGHQQFVFNDRQQHLNSLFQLYSQQISSSNEVSVSSKGTQHILSGKLWDWEAESTICSTIQWVSSHAFCFCHLFMRLTVLSMTSWKRSLPGSWILFSFFISCCFSHTVSSLHPWMDSA